ncbi:FecR domain-containing protein [Hymenobacter sp. DH14]|uniref:FecR domain-containing protein n=1 Tax=Hymenobacter cyanobacteriorum TaxID=2926463 RepID=A0A9X1VHA0_9BACT|nr:FecR family protein [Hymenobacter cyanobacteriorum]MCI1189139.1 FecR domain-containing protein [Hymenobacter cyanobacteriorum]
MASNSSEFRQLLQRYQQGECSPEEVRCIEAWYRQLGNEQPFDLTSHEKEALAATVWQRIAGNTTGGNERSPKSTGWASWPTSVRAAAVAAGVLAAGAIGIQLAHSPLPQEVVQQPATVVPAPATWLVYSAPATAPERRVALPDGSFVTLAPGATLRYQRANATGRRIAYLKGEAFFDVFHDEQHPFSVLTDQVVSTVLGTSFRVRAVAGQPDVQVQVRTGAVRVRPRVALAGAAPAAGIVVRPNQQAVYSPTRRQLWRELVAEPVLLAPQSFVFNDRPVAEVLQTLSAAYGVAISYDAEALRNCTLNLSLGNEPLFDKLNLVCEALGARYETADGRIVFHGQPCAAE